VVIEILTPSFSKIAIMRSHEYPFYRKLLISFDNEFTSFFNDKLFLNAGRACIFVSYQHSIF
jgi:hypothetical protein